MNGTVIQSSMRTRKRTNLGFGVACILIILIGLSSYFSLREYIKDSNKALQSFNIRNVIEGLSSDLMEAKASVRGYHLSGQEVFLTEYEVARARLHSQIETLKQNTKKNPVQKRELILLEDLIEKRFRYWDESISLRKEKGGSVLQTLVKNIPFTQDSDRKIKESFLRMDVKDESIGIVSKVLGQSSNWVVLFIFFGTITAVLLIVSAAYMVNSDVRKREAAENEVEVFFNVSLDLLCISGTDGYFKKLGPAWTDVLGYSLEELFKRPLLDLVHPDDLSRTQQEVSQQAKGEKTLSFENRWKCKDGTFVDLSWKSVQVEDKMYGVARDITRQKIFERQLIEAEKNSLVAAKVKSEFLANMSHEIRTPLNGIIGVTDLLENTSLNEEQKKFTNTIKNSGSMLLKIINEILDFSKIEAGKLEVEKNDFQVNQILEGQVSIVGPLAHEKNLQLTSYVDPQIPAMVRGDSGRIAQILLNLVNNAIKFTDSGTIDIRVELLSETKDGLYLKFCVKDTGMGLSDEQKERIFTAFNQADGSTARRFGGTGLGLSISKKLTELMGGEIGVKSAPGEGSNFWFTIKLEHSTKQTVKETSKTPSTKTRSIRILVAEDNQVNQMIIKKMLEKLGHSVHVVSNGLEAVNTYKEASYDMILMDHHMPVMDGMEATAIIRQMEGPIKKLPILAFTANVLEESQVQFVQAGADDFIMKPVTLNVLEETLRKWI
jgi:PAS domain S-box-containing protein